VTGVQTCALPIFVDEILIFDAKDHWFCLFVGCRALGLPFELSLRIGKAPAEGGPPTWFVEPVTRVANAIGDGARCAPGVTWVLGSLGAPDSQATGFLTLPDLEFGKLEGLSVSVLQLVPATPAELALRGAELEQLCVRLQGDRSRLIGSR
jgi:hypothetical protein